MISSTNVAAPGLNPNRTHLTSFAASFAVIYVHMWIAEGALRKWVPGVGEVMYVARDVLAVVVLALLILSRTPSRRSAWPFWVAIVVLVAAAGSTVVVANLPPQVAVVGLRSYLAPFVLPALVYSFAPRSTLARMARAVLLWLPLQLIIGGAQGILPPSSPINREISGEESRFIQGGVVRITGTFTAPSGLTSYLIIAFAILISALVGGVFIRRSLAILLLLTAVTTVSISGSRGTVLGVAIVLGCAVVHSVLTKPGLTVRLTATVAVVGGAAWLAAVAFFPQVVKAFADRFVAADRVENTGGRLLTQTFGFLSPDHFSPFGSGLGGTSIVGIALGSGQSWVEVESIRWVVELGILGLLLAAVRLLCGVGLVVAVFAFPWHYNFTFVALSAVIAPTLIFGAIGQNPSYQGAFAVALTMAILAVDGVVPSDQGEDLNSITRNSTKGLQREAQSD